MLELKVVARGLPFHCTTELLRKLLPVTLKVKALLPTGTDVGLMEFICAAGVGVGVATGVGVGVGEGGVEPPPPQPDKKAIRAVHNAARMGVKNLLFLRLDTAELSSTTVIPSQVLKAIFPPQAHSEVQHSQVENFWFEKGEYCTRVSGRSLYGISRSLSSDHQRGTLISFNGYGRTYKFADNNYSKPLAPKARTSLVRKY